MCSFVLVLVFKLHSDNLLINKHDDDDGLSIFSPEISNSY